MKKEIIFHSILGGGSYQASVKGDENKENWGKIDGETVFDYQLKAIKEDAKKDGFKVTVTD